jgi:hypothetical protein
MAKKSRRKRRAHAATKRAAIKKGLIAYVKGGSSQIAAWGAMRKAGVSQAEFKKAIHEPASEYMSEKERLGLLKESKTSKRRRSQRK